MAIVKVSPVRVKGIQVDESTLCMKSEEEIKNQILGTHAPNPSESESIDVKAVFAATDCILTLATSIVDCLLMEDQTLKEDLSEKTLKAGFTAPAGIIQDITREMGCKALHGEHAHDASLSLLSMLSSYSWDAKAVVTLSAFAVKYGMFWLLSQHQSDQLAKSLAFLRGIPISLKLSGSQKPGILLLNNLVKVALEITRGVIQIERYSMKYPMKDVPALATALKCIPVYAYWIITTVVCCASHLGSFMDEENAVQELSILSNVLTDTSERLQKQLNEISWQREEYTAYHFLSRLYVQCTENVEFLNVLTYGKDDMSSLVYGSTKHKAKIEELRKKHVLLHISTVFISSHELMTLQETYYELKKEAESSQFEILWIPIVEEWTEEVQLKFQSITTVIPWYFVHYPSSPRDTPTGRATLKFIREEWHFQGNSIVVSLGPNGEVRHRNCYHMLCIWGHKAFPFTISMEKALWQNLSWNTELLLDDIHPTFQNWIKEGKCIFIYGGTDLKCVEDFENRTKFVATLARLPLELLNVCRNSEGKTDKNIIDIFWKRFDSLWISKIHSNAHGEQDIVMHELEKIKKNNSTCWVVFCRGSKVIINQHGSIVLTALLRFDDWKKNVSGKGFDAAFQEYVMLLLEADGGHVSRQRGCIFPGFVFKKCICSCDV